MKRLLLITALSLASLSSFAQSQSGSEASNAGNTQQIIVQSGGASTVTQTVSGTTTQNIVQSGSTSQNINSSGGTDSTMQNNFGTQVIKNTPSVGSSNLTTSNDTCMGSSAGSANLPGVGLSLGTTWTDANCKLLKNSRELWNMGMKAASMALLCKDLDNREALESTGFDCPQTTPSQRVKYRTKVVDQASNANPSEPADPYVRARMGLEPLKPLKE